MPEDSSESYQPNVNELSKTHEKVLIYLKKTGASDSQILRVAQALAVDRKQIARVGIDALTGLPQADLCQQKIESYLARGIPITVEFNDLLYLKTFNETTSHERTNDLLKEIAKIYKKHQELFRQKGTEVYISRYAGDEFVVVIPEKGKEEAAEMMGEIHKDLNKIPKPEGSPIKPHFSRGMAFSDDFPGNERNYRNLINHADLQAKNNKLKIRNRLESFSPDLTAALKRYG